MHVAQHSERAIYDLLIGTDIALPGRPVVPGYALVDVYQSFENGNDRFAVLLTVDIEARAAHANLTVVEQNAERARRIVHDVEQCFALEQLHAPVARVAGPFELGTGIEVGDAAVLESDRARFASAGYIGLRT